MSSEVETLVQTKDWSTTSLGPREEWPQSLQIALRILLGSRYAMWLGWGPELRFFYNDAYAQMTLGKKHPWALGRPAAEVWPEIWADIGPRAESVMATGIATWDEGLMLFLERSDFREETYHTFSYSPLPGDSGDIAGMLCVVTEDTERIIGERRLRTLRELAEGLSSTATEDGVGRAISERIGANTHDLPFTLTYLFDETAATASLVATTGIERGSAAAPATIALPDAEAAWPAHAIAERRDVILIEDLARRFTSLPRGAWDVAPTRAVLVPIGHQGQDRLTGFLVAGVNPYRAFDAEYRSFVELLAGQIAAGVANSRAYEEERRRAAALAELDRAKTTFFSNVSHEFRTPLTLMLGPIEDLLNAQERTDAEREQLALVHRNGQRLLKLVNNLLEFSRIEAGRMQARFEPTDLAGMTADVASAFRSAIERAGMRLVIDCPPLPEPVHVDREMWEKVLLNLISNAFKYTLEGEIAVSLRARAGGVELIVRDTGTGIPADELPKIWSRFHRVEGAHGRTHEGTGIGLALVNELVKLHGGAVDVESEVGRGSTFRITIPFGTHGEHAVRPGDARTGASARAYVEEALRWLPGADAAPATSMHDLPSQAYAGEDRPRILLADDNSDMRDYITRLLSDRFAITGVADGKHALEIALADPPDLVLTDVMMPNLDGFGLLRALRDDPSTSTVPVIMLSARAGEEARVEGLRAGADDYLIKPFSARELIARVGGTLALARSRRDAHRREEELRAETTSVLETIAEGFLALDEDFRYTYVNAEAQRLIGLPRGALIGRSIWDAFPRTLGTELEREYRRVMTTRAPGKLEHHSVRADRWYGVDIYPAKDGGLAVYFRDITERRRRTEQLQQVAAAAVAVNGMLSIRDILQTVVDRAREIIGAREAVIVLDLPSATAQRAVAHSSEETVISNADSIATPLVSADGAPVGSLRLTSKLTGDDFTAADHAILAQIGQSASVALANAQLHRTAESARAEAERANRAKDEFLAMLGHELRNPLAPIATAIDLMKLRGETHSLRERNVIERQLGHITRLVDDLLDVSRITRGKLELAMRPVDVADIIARAAEMASPLLEQRRHELTTTVAPGLSAFADPARLAQIVSNLLTNAAKYTQPNGRIEVEATGSASEVIIRVRDNGQGISPELLPHIFDLFVQGKRTFDRSEGGLGIGLSLVKNLVTLHGGTVSAESPGVPGRGSELTVRLPRHLQAVDPATPVPAAAAPRGTRKRVLVVDDNRDFAEMLSTTLDTLGYEVTMAADGPSALERLRDFPAEAAVLDLGLPVIDGFELARKIREAFPARTPRLIAVTGYGQQHDRERSAHVGFSDHLVKPIDMDAMVAALERPLSPPAPE